MSIILDSVELTPLLSIDPDELSQERWTSVLKVADKLQFHKYHQVAVARVDVFYTNVIARLQIAHAYGITEWLRPGYEELVNREAPVDTDEARQIGWTCALRLGHIREKRLTQNIPYVLIHTLNLRMIMCPRPPLRDLLNDATREATLTEAVGRSIENNFGNIGKVVLLFGLSLLMKIRSFHQYTAHVIRFGDLRRTDGLLGWTRSRTNRGVQATVRICFIRGVQGRRHALSRTARGIPEAIVPVPRDVRGACNRWR